MNVASTAKAPLGGNIGFLSGGGELGSLIRAHDWARTALGPPQSWPQNLRMALRVMLTSRQPIWVGWGPELIYFYNDAYKSIIGGRHPWALGQPTRRVWAEIWEDIGPMLRTAMGGDQGTFVESQLLIMLRNGYPEETYYTFSYSPIPNDDGSVGGIFCANSEDTQRVIGERQLSVLRSLAAETARARNRLEVCERAADALAVNARDVPFALMYLPTADGASLQLAGASGIERAHEAAPALIELSNAQPAWPLGEVLRSHSLITEQDLGRRFTQPLPTGPWPEPPTEAALLPIISGGDSARAGVLVVGLNRFRLFDDNYRSFLNLVVGQLAAALANAEVHEEERRRAEALAEIDRAKTTFFSNVSHEFRTPLTLMLGPIEDALNDVSDAALAPPQRRRLQTAHRNSLRLLRLVNTLLDFSRIEAGRVQAQFVATDLAGLTGELASNFQSAMDKAGLELAIRCEPLPHLVYVDRDMYEKIVLNLVSNAFKFTFQGHIDVQTRVSPDGQAVQLLVRDTGVGIPADQISRLFERFHRVEGQQSRSFEGSGIGLALVQELVRIHGGAIDIDSTVGRGSTFLVSLPLGSAHLPAERVGAAHGSSLTSLRADAYVREALRWLPESGQSGSTLVEDRAEEEDLPVGVPTDEATILIVDDNADMRRYLWRLLGRRWRVEVAGSGLEALALIRQHRPELVLSDVMMPELDGFGLLREIRADPDLRDLSVILLSARAGEDARVEGLDASADDYLTKPFAARELLARVNTNLVMARMRREVTRELRESEARFRNMADNAPVMMWMSDPDGSLTYLNRVWSAFTGQTDEMALGQGAWQAVHEDDRPEAQGLFRRANAAREAFRIEYRLRRADGDYRWALSAAAPRFGADGEFRGYIGSVIDITERKEAEQVLEQANELLEARVAVALADRAEAEAQLRQSQKMEAIGKLTGGVAHDFNNVLQVIGGNLQLLMREVAGNPRAEQRVQTAVASLVRGSKLAAQLLAFGRRQPLAPKVINLGRLIRGIDDMLRRAIGEGIEIETIVAGGLWNTFVDAAQVENALLNLAINSRDAMGGHGKLTIELGNASLDDDYVTRHADVLAGQYVMLAVTDTGCGIDPALLERVFEPFFTTKSEGQGTGLGLSMVYGFVKQSGGHVKLYSELGQGTTVRIYLPRSRAGEDVQVEVESSPPTGGSETVLVVEDDDDVRSTVIDMLCELGYQVLRAKDAQSALAIVESGVHIDVLFTDVVMPGLVRSPELARKTRERRPEIAVLFTSGYTENAIVHGGRLDEGIELLSKPYGREALARKIRHVLRGQRHVARADGTSRAASAPAVAVAQDRTDALHVLVVEDDPDIRYFTVQMLQNRGHAVEEAVNAHRALELLGTKSFDAVVTDLVLPGVSGARLAEQALERQPSLGVVFASGYDSLPGADQAGTLSRASFLRKPFDEEALQDAVLKAVGRQPQR